MIAVVILSYNDADYVIDCVKSVRWNSLQDYRLIIVNNGCDERNTRILNNLNADYYIALPSNTGLPNGYNAGIKRGLEFADHICLLNADTKVETKGWLGNMLSVFHEKTDAGEVAAVTNKIANRVQNWKRYKNKLPNKVLPAKWVGLGMTMIPAYVFVRAGLLDEKMSPGASVDVEYSFRLRKLGHGIYVDGHTYVWHKGKVAFDQLDVKYRTLLKRNNAYVKEKYPELWQESFRK